MKPTGPLMVEHRLIEKMIKVMNNKISEFEKNGEVSPLFINTVVDFINMYADKTHHGKEEDILFHRCSKKSLTEDDAIIMNELIEEHKLGRKIADQLVEANNEYMNGKGNRDKIIKQLKEFTAFYPVHIKKEDNHFYPNSEKYFSRQELQNMLEEFWDFDKAMIHKKYESVVDDLLKNKTK